MSFDDIQWRNIDLNLLVAFSYLYQHRSVSVAADKACVSQSAMSHSLGRLRVLLNDPLFERKGHSMLPTERANHIAPTVAHLLDTIAHNVLVPAPFEPNQYDGICRIGLTDYAELIFAAELYDAIRAQAPHAQVSFINVNRSNYVAMCEQDKLDVIIGCIPEPHEMFNSAYLYTEQHVCLGDPNTLGSQSNLSIEAFANIEQALVSPDGSLVTQVDKTLLEHGLSRKVTVASRNFLTLQRLLSGRKLVAIVPKLMAHTACQTSCLTTFAPPIPVADFDISMLWLRNKEREDKGLWLRQLVANVVSG